MNLFIQFNTLIAYWVKNLADNILKYFLKKFHRNMSHLDTVCMKCQSLISGKNKKIIINLLVELVQRVVNVNVLVAFNVSSSYLHLYLESMGCYHALQCFYFFLKMDTSLWGPRRIV